MEEREKLKEYEANLRNTILNSADVLPEKVSNYLTKVALSEDSNSIEQAFRENYLLVRHLTSDFVNFAIDTLITKPPTSHGIGVYDEFPHYGIETYTGFYPPTHVHGPFLSLLRKDENEGLRLIHTITNRAIERWREIEPSATLGSGKNPLPISIKLSTGIKFFWGNEQVYGWFRYSSDGADIMTAALMALEFWLEKQVAKDRSPKELFEKVLSGSDCVALIGVCLGVALAYPEKCLEASLPFIISSAIWRMDMERARKDKQYPYSGFSRDIFLYDVQKERGECPQRSRSIKFLLKYYALCENESLKVDVKQAISGFSIDLPFLYEEEQESIQKEAIQGLVEYFQVIGDFANYNSLTDETHLTEDKFAPMNDEREQGLPFFQQQLQSKYSTKEPSLEEVAEISKKFLKQGKFHFPNVSTLDRESYSELEYIIRRTERAIIYDMAQTQQLGLVDWCHHILLAASRTQQLKHLVGVGLCGLILQGAGSDETRKTILLLAAEPNLFIVGNLFRGVIYLWERDFTLCWNAFSLCLSLSLRPRKFRSGNKNIPTDRPSFTKRLLLAIKVLFQPIQETFSDDLEEDTWIKQILNPHITNLKKNELPTLPRLIVNKNIDFFWRLISCALYSIPIKPLLKDSTLKSQLLQLNDDFINILFDDDLESLDDYYDFTDTRERNDFFLKWFMALMLSLSYEEAREHIIDKIKGKSDYLHPLIEVFLNSYISKYIVQKDPPSTKIQEQWKDISNLILDDPYYNSEIETRHFDYSTREALSRIIFVRYELSDIGNTWEHITLFSDLIAKWIKVVGHNPQAYSILLSMFNSIGWQFGVEKIIEWLSIILDNSSNTERLYKNYSNGEKTAKLLHRIWKSFEPIRQNIITLQRYSRIVDTLLSVGIPSSSLLQTELEKIRNHP